MVQTRLLIEAAPRIGLDRICLPLEVYLLGDFVNRSLETVGSIFCPTLHLSQARSCFVAIEVAVRDLELLLRSLDSVHVRRDLDLVYSWIVADCEIN